MISPADYELRVEHRHEPFADEETVVWHITRAGKFTSVCDQLLSPVAATVPMNQIETVPPEALCPECSGWYRAILEGG
ncbi:hypothetical protein ABIA32_002726 [Streptacidiphilus sp. MAP12-20]|uniref:hypothetical protein n=1 Tax=Streptacidiphilus sp. MAP12-20 TaxID=3156299 RepID=UPI00351640B6